jgi:hypothetical protein
MPARPISVLPAKKGNDMNQHSRAVWLLASGLLVWTSLVISDAAATGGSTAAAAADPPDVVAFKAGRPHPALGDHAKLFGRLVGTWDVEYTDFSKDGTATRRTGQMTFGWVLDGRAIQDLWIVDPSGAGKEREVYADLHYFDAQSGAWHTVFVDPEHASVLRFTDEAAGDDRIVLDSHDLNDEETRWSFNDIRCGSFGFRSEVSRDGGKTWRLQSDYRMKRRSAAARHAETRNFGYLVL